MVNHFLVALKAKLKIHIRHRLRKLRAVQPVPDFYNKSPIFRVDAVVEGIKAADGAVAYLEIEEFRHFKVSGTVVFVFHY